MLDLSIIGAAASKKCKFSTFVNSPIFFDKLSEVNGPVAIIIILFLGSSWFIYSSLIISILELFSISRVISLENSSLSTASACPAGTATLSAHFINKESNFLSSSFNSQQAFVIRFDLN